jgi:hypothetical protein
MAQTTPTPHRSSHDEEPDIQQRFGYVTWLWTIGSGLLIAALIIMLLMSIFGFWSNPWIAPPV